MNVEGWLQDLGLARYAKAFAEHAIDLDVLPELTEADLEKLGIPLGHRKKLLKAIRNLGAESAQSAAIANGSPLAAVRSEAERRQLTVMFVDLVGSTELSLKLDPEELRDLLRAYQDALGREVARYGGNVAKYMGDGVLVYFGYPQAHEDDAVRSIYAGLAVVRAVKQLGKRILAAHGGRLRARVGIATGLVVVGDLVGAEGSEAGAVTGETPNLAFRLQSLAGSGRVVVAEGTRALAGEAFTYEESEEHRLKGFLEPVRLWRVLGPSGAESRFEALHGHWLTPLVGREHELALLLERWLQAKDGEGQVVLISGEAGIGKSRITEVLRERVMADDHIRIRLQCSPYHTNSALYPTIEHLERAAGLERDDTPEVKLDKLEAMIAEATASVGETAALFAPLLSIPTGERYPPLSMTPERQKERTLAALTEQVMGLAAKAPVLVIVEDAHWIDPTTLESLDLTIARLEASRVLLVMTFRPEFQPKWLERPNVTNLALNRLSKRQGMEMVKAVTGGRALPREILDQVVARTDGVPLFVEELTRMVLESGILREKDDHFVLDGPLPPLAIPATLHDSLTARLDRLTPSKQVAQTASAIGRTFDHDLLAAVALLDDAQLVEALAQLVKAGLIFRHGAGTGATYAFKHALVQGAAYESMLKSQRQRLHARIAMVMETTFREMAEATPDVVARHFIEAGLNDPAIEWSTKAGTQAFKRSANLEAIPSFKKALELIDSATNTGKYRDLELEILMTLGTALTAAKGYGDPETLDVYNRAVAQCRNIDNVGTKLNVLYGSWASYVAMSQYNKSWLLTLEAKTVVDNANDKTLKFCSTYMFAYEFLARGNFEESYKLFLNLKEEYDDDRDNEFCFNLSEHCGRLVDAYIGLLSFYIGIFDSILNNLELSIERLKNVNHYNSVMIGMFFYSYLLKEFKHYDKALAVANELIEYGTEHIVPFWRRTGIILKGVTLCRLGSETDGMELIREGVREFVSKSETVQAPQFFSYLGEACLITKNFEEGLTAVAEGLRRATETEENFFTAELYRNKGELLQAKGNVHPQEIEETYLAAMDVARTQGSHTFELRAAMSLARFWAERGDNQRAHALLAPIYGWFTNGFDTCDLKEAKALLMQFS